uniref:Uncharacterized protein n=1 Tax=Anguilla anguilla TaxID=7936 RepID=A0A0E9T3W9_ANGAN
MLDSKRMHACFQ